MGRRSRKERSRTQQAEECHPPFPFPFPPPTTFTLRFARRVAMSKAGEHIFARGTAAGKRVQSNMGAKNHVVVLPDADRREEEQACSQVAAVKY